MDEAKVENFKPESTESDTSEKLRVWIENGFNDKAVAAYGTSYPQLLEILDLGDIPPHPDIDPLAYQTEFRTKGKLLYYFCVLGQNLLKSNPNLYKQVAESAKEIGESEGDFDNDNGRGTAHIYAEGNAFDNVVSNALGVDEGFEEGIVENALDIEKAEEWYRKSLEEFRLESDDERWKGLEKTYEIVLKNSMDFRQRLIDNKVDFKALKEAIETTRGIIIYFNNKIFDESTFFTGREGDSEEFVLARHKPLSLDTISGIEILGEKQLQELKVKYAI